MSGEQTTEKIKSILFVDVETSGLPEWAVPSDDPTQPHICQLAGILCDAETQKTIQSLDVIIRPDGWEIPEDMTAIHGITMEMAMDVGIPEKLAVEMLLAICGDSDRCAYNKTFDQRIVRIALKRFFDEPAIDKWALKDNFFDSMRMTQKFFGGKNMKLVDAYKKVTGLDLEDAHSAMADTIACRDIYFELRGKV